MNIGRTVAGALALTLLSVSAEPAQACRFFDRLCGKPVTTYYAPVAAPQPVCCARPVTCCQPVTCCAQRPVVSYMPQTAYRSVVVNRPVTSYVPTTACNACGQATTVMRPVTSYVRQTQMVPYTTYRPVVSSVAAPQPCCGATPTMTSYAPAVSTVPVAAPAAPSCCGGSPAATAMPAPSLSSSSTIIRAPATTSSTIVGSPATSTTTPVPVPDPSLSDPAPTPAPGSPQTFTPDDTQSRVLMPPSSGPANTYTRPRGLDPQDEDRTTAIPLRSKMTVRQASLVVPAQTETKPLDDGGWRAAGR